MPYRRARAWPSGFRQSARASKGILHTNQPPKPCPPEYCATIIPFLIKYCIKNSTAPEYLVYKLPYRRACEQRYLVYNRIPCMQDTVSRARTRPSARATIVYLVYNRIPCPPPPIPCHFPLF